MDSAKSTTLSLPSPLLSDIAEGRCLPFIGAGFSLNARLAPPRAMPDWPALTAILARDAGTASTLTGPEVAARFETLFGRVQLVEAVRRALHTEFARPGSAHLAFADLPFDTVYTTNFDLLLESAYQSRDRPYRSLVGELQMPFHGGAVTTNIIKMHGDLRHEEHIILTEQDYQTYLDKYPVISTHLAAMLITRTPLFIGYSLSDPDFLHVWEVVRSRLGKFTRMAYVIQFDKSSVEVEHALSENLHILSIPTGSASRDDLLSEVFRAAQSKLDTMTAIRARSTRPDTFEEVEPELIDRASRSGTLEPLLSASSKLCFVLMPFAPQYEPAYRQLIRPVVEQLGLTALRADEIYAPGSIVEQIRSSIQQARLCIADVTGSNANVLYELGIAQTMGKATIILSTNMGDVPFDLRTNRVVLYDLTDLEKSLTVLLSSAKDVLGEGNLEESRRLINGGMYRAAMAVLSIQLEQVLFGLAERHGIPLRSKTSLGGMMRALQHTGVIAKDDIARLQVAITHRNEAFHSLIEPDSKDASEMLLTVEHIHERYGSREVRMNDRELLIEILKQNTREEMSGTEVEDDEVHAFVERINARLARQILNRQVRAYWSPVDNEWWEAGEGTAL